MKLPLLCAALGSALDFGRYSSELRTGKCVSRPDTGYHAHDRGIGGFEVITLEMSPRRLEVLEIEPRRTRTNPFSRHNDPVEFEPLQRGLKFSLNECQRWRLDLPGPGFARCVHDGTGNQQRRSCRRRWDIQH